MKRNVAHVVKDSCGEFRIQTIEEHHAGVSLLASDFAGTFSSEEWGVLLGAWHDVGKYNKAFQDYIGIASGMTTGSIPPKVDHASVGAILSKEKLPKFYHPLAYCIAGHHSGLPDWFGGLELRLKKKELYEAAMSSSDSINFDYMFSPVVKAPFKDPEREMHLWIRMLFSCLVDADWLDTERFMNPERYALRGQYDSLDILKGRFDSYMSQKSQEAAQTDINRIRAGINAQCRKCGAKFPGLFSLTVPTGGGKTLAAMAWALEHALKHDKKRIIVAIPYTSIIAQTAKEYRRIFGENNVVEHHSNILPDDLSESNRLAAENWDAPVIVTTNVQLFESLYSNKPSKCRKLHNLANSIIILDEAQMLPVEFLKPVLHTLQGLRNVFGASILFCTATQPVFTGRIGGRLGAFAGLTETVNEMVADVNRVFDSLKRVSVVINDNNNKLSYDKLAEELQRYDRVLCIVNTRKEAQAIYSLMPEGTVHLSRMMCSAHIIENIDKIKKRLHNGEPVRVVSTQLIEAGVDIDFPVVYRAFAGLDSIVQAAGRCNREGKLGGLGLVKVFRTEHSIPSGLIRKGADALRNMILDGDCDDYLSPVTLRKYFQKYYREVRNFDKADTKRLLYDGVHSFKFQFAEASDKFRLIDDKDAMTVIVGYGDGASLIERLKREGPETWLLRRMQPYSVPVYKKDFEELLKAGIVTKYHDVNVLEDIRNYDRNVGLVLDNNWLLEPLFV